MCALITGVIEINGTNTYCAQSGYVGAATKLAGFSKRPFEYQWLCHCDTKSCDL